MRSKYKKIADRIIMFTAVITIIAGIVIGVQNKMENGTFVGLSLVVISIILLATYMITEKIFKQKLSIIPEAFYYIAFIFAFFSVYLGSLFNFYERYAWWDDALHFMSGILIGLLMIIITSFLVIKRYGKLRRKSDIAIIVIIGVLLSISIAVFWEFYEFSYDYLFDGNMQRSIIVTDPANFDVRPYLRPSGRFVDPGLLDTMGDFFQAVCGAFIAGAYCFTHYMIISKNIIDYSEEKNISIEDYRQEIMEEASGDKE